MAKLYRITLAGRPDIIVEADTIAEEPVSYCTTRFVKTDEEYATLAHQRGECHDTNVCKICEQQSTSYRQGLQEGRMTREELRAEEAVRMATWRQRQGLPPCETP